MPGYRACAFIDREFLITWEELCLPDKMKSAGAGAATLSLSMLL